MTLICDHSGKFPWCMNCFHSKPHEKLIMCSVEIPCQQLGCEKLVKGKRKQVNVECIPYGDKDENIKGK
jgi:hypothetical protein